MAADWGLAPQRGLVGAKFEQSPVELLIGINY